MIELVFNFLQSLDSIWIYAVIFLVAYIENLFPPSPSDIMIVAGGYLIGIGKVDFISALVIATFGSTAGFMTMYKIGDWFGLSIIEKGKLKFLPIDRIHKVESWFRNYGYWLIVINRFLSGTRAIVGFFAGMSEVKFFPTAVLCFVSALLWNGILLYLGTLLGENWKVIDSYLSTYSQIVTLIIVIGIVIGLYFLAPKKNKTV